MPTTFAKLFGAGRAKDDQQPVQAQADVGGLPVFCIVTPVFNGAEYIDDTIYSVLSQAGDFVLHYHIQDGGSTDGTMEKVRRWIALSETLPPVCRKLVFTCACERDGGMYDAINKGFAAALPPGDDVVMGWIAADDRVAQGACATIMGIRETFPDVRFLGGRVALIDATGSIIGVHSIYPFSRRCMAAGLYDGRALQFIMQEGSLWCADLWRKVGGLDTGFRLAGDWDLWRRMAVHEPYFIADTILGFHRRRPGQLSEQMGRYYDELDAALCAPMPDEVPAVLASAVPARAVADEPLQLQALYGAIAAEYERIRTDAPRFRASFHAATVIRFNLQQREWERTPGFGLTTIAPELVSIAGAAVSLAIIPTQGFQSPEGPYPEFGMPLPIRWMSGPLAEGEVDVTQPGRYRIVIRCRSWTRNQTATILADGKPLGRLVVTAHAHDRDIQLAAEADFASGTHVIGIEVDQPSMTDRFLLLIDWRIDQLVRQRQDAALPAPQRPLPLAVRSAQLPGGRSWPRISIVVPTRNQGHFIRDTLDSILVQAYPNLDLIVVDGQSTDETAMILRDYAPYLSRLIAEPDHGQSDAINKGMRAATGDILSWLNSDDLLAPGALHAVAHAFLTASTDMVAGLCRVFDDANLTSHAHLPCIADGPLPLADILDLENHWLRGQFFHQPEIFFSRAIWERSGGRVDEQLFYSMDYDLWVRMARQGATIQVIGAPLAHYRTHAAQKTSTVQAYLPELTAHAEAIRTELGMGALPAPAASRQRLKIVLFNDYGFKYGAGIAHRRIGAALAAAGHEITALAYADFDLGPPSEPLTAEQTAEAILELRPDLILVGNLHSIAADFDLLGALLPSRVPTLFYAHDHWVGTGRCPYPGACTRYASQCNAQCPTAELYPALPRDRVAPVFDQRRAVIAAARDHFAILTNSGHMRDFFQGALAHTGAPPVHVAPIGIDTGVFDLGDRWRARMILDLPQHRFIIATAAANVADTRKGLPLLLAALEQIGNRDDILVLVLGFGGALPEAPFEIRQTGYLADEDVVALHHQAADLFVGPSVEEAFGQTYIEAGACGVPSIAFAVGGVSDAIIDGLTGILVGQIAPEALAVAIVRLRVDPALRYQMGIQARLHACNRFSIAASAAKLVTILASEPALNLRLAPTVVFPNDPQRLHVDYLNPPAEAPVFPQLPWMPGENMIEETVMATAIAPPRRFWWGIWPAISFLIRGEADGAHVLTLHVRCHIPDQEITVSVDRGPLQTIKIAESDLDIVQVLQIPVDLVRGVNRVDIGFARFVHEEVGTRRALCVLFEDVITVRGSPEYAGAPHDGYYELLTGYDEEEGPYPDMGLPSPFHWAVGSQSKLRIYSGYAGSRRWTLRLRNGHPGQRLTIRIDNVVIVSEALSAHVLTIPITIAFDAHIEVGFHTLAIESDRQTGDSDDPRRMAFMFEALDVALPGEEGEPIANAVRWDISAGFTSDDADPNAWRVTGLTPTLVIDAARAASVILRIDYRCPMEGQTSLLTVNGERCSPLDLAAGYGGEPSYVRRRVSLREGQNFLNFEFLHALPSPSGGKLAAIVDAVTTSSAEGVDDSTMIDPAPLTYRCAAGFSHPEEPWPEGGLDRPFRWAVDGESVIRFSEPVTRIKVRLRNQHEGQSLTFTGDDGRSVSVALGCALAQLQDVDLALGEGGSRNLLIRSSMVGDGNEQDPRRLAFILETLESETGRVIQASA